MARLTEDERRAVVLRALRVAAVANDKGWTVMAPAAVEGGRRGSVKTITVQFSMDYAHWIQAERIVDAATKKRDQRAG